MKRSPKKRGRLSLQALESRKLMAADFGLAGSTLAIQGSPMDDAAEVYLESDRVVVKVSTYDDSGAIVSEKEDEFGLEEINRIVFEGLDGDDLFTNESSIDAVARGGAGNDLLMGGTGNDRLVGGIGDDLILGGGGNDLLYAGLGDDVVIETIIQSDADEVDSTDTQDLPGDELDPGSELDPTSDTELSGDEEASDQVDTADDAVDPTDDVVDPAHDVVDTADDVVDTADDAVDTETELDQENDPEAASESDPVAESESTDDEEPVVGDDSVAETDDTESDTEESNSDADPTAEDDADTDPVGDDVTGIQDDPTAEADDADTAEQTSEGESTGETDDWSVGDEPIDPAAEVDETEADHEPSNTENEMPVIDKDSESTIGIPPINDPSAVGNEDMMEPTEGSMDETSIDTDADDRLDDSQPTADIEPTDNTPVDVDEADGEQETDNDIIFGGSGDDWIFAAGGHDLIFADASPIDDELLRCVIGGRLRL